MIVKIEKQYLSGAVLTTNEPPLELEFFDAYDGGDVTYCYITDGFETYLAVPFEVIANPDPVVENLPRMVGVEILDEHGLPHGLPHDQ